MEKRGDGFFFTTNTRTTRRRLCQKRRRPRFGAPNFEEGDLTKTSRRASRKATRGEIFVASVFAPATVSTFFVEIVAARATSRPVRFTGGTTTVPLRYYYYAVLRSTTRYYYGTTRIQEPNEPRLRRIRKHFKKTKKRRSPKQIQTRARHNFSAFCFRFVSRNLSLFLVSLRISTSCCSPPTPRGRVRLRGRYRLKVTRSG